MAVLAKTKQPDIEITSFGLIAPPPIHIETERFSGSLATLVDVARQHRIDLREVPLHPVCEAYFEYILAASLENLDQAAAAFLALSYLLERKAWLLLPSAEPEPDHADALEFVAPSVSEFDAAIEALRIWHSERERFFFRTAEPPEEVQDQLWNLEGVEPSDLAQAFERLLAKANPDPVTPSSPSRKSLTELMDTVRAALSSEWKTLEVLVEAPFTKLDAVYWFLALLELLRLREAKVKMFAEGVRFAR